MPRDFDRPRRVLLEWDARTGPVFTESTRGVCMVPGDRGKVGAIAGPIAVASTTAANGTGIAHPVLLRPDTDGVACLQFDGITNTFGKRLRVAAAPLRVTKQVTFAALVKVYAFDGGNVNTPFLNAFTTTSGAANFGWRNTGAINFYVRDLTAARNVGTGSGGSIRGAGWKRLIATYDGNWVRGWVDGVALTPGRAEGYAFTCDTFEVFNGANSAKLAYVLVTDYALKFGEVEALDARMAAVVSTATAETWPAPATAPAALPALDSLYDSTTGVATSGSNVTAWDSASGATAIQLTVPASYTAPTVQTEAGVQVVEFGVGNAAIGANLGASRTVTAMTVHVVGRLLTQTAQVRAVSHGTNRAGPNLNVVGGQVSAATDATDWGGFGQPVRSSNHAARDGKWHVWSYTFDGGGRLVQAYLDGAETGPFTGALDSNVQAVATTITSYTQGGVWLGASATSGAGSQTGLRVAGVVHHTAALTPYQVRQFARWVRTDSQWADLFTGWDTGNLVVWTGSSNLITGQATEEDIPVLALRDAGNTKYERMYSTAQSGSQSQFMVLRFEREVAKLCDGVSGTKVVCMYAGGNDLVNNSLAAVQTHVAACSSHLRATISGVKIVIGTQLPRTGVNDTDRATYNAWLAANTGAGLNLADALADMASDATIGGNGQNVMPNYLDGVHLTTAGTVIAVPYWVTAIEGVLP